MTAEELAPYLDVPSAAKDADSHVVDESYVVPALVRFGGSPEVDQDNNLIYRFPSLQKTGRRQVTTYTLHLWCNCNVTILGIVCGMTFVMYMLHFLSVLHWKQALL